MSAAIERRLVSDTYVVEVKIAFRWRKLPRQGGWLLINLLVEI